MFVLVFSYFMFRLNTSTACCSSASWARLYAAGSSSPSARLMQYQAVVILGAFLVYTGIRMMFHGEQKLELEKNPIIKLEIKNHARLV